MRPRPAKTDAKDAFIIADAARAMPHTLRAIDGEDETIADDRRLRRRPGRRGHQSRRPTPRPAHPDPALPGTSPGAEVAAPGRPRPARTLRIPGPDPQSRPAPTGHPDTTESTAWPSAWSRTSSMPSRSRPSPAPRRPR
ncbi:transposase [Streptomyces sp. NPDC005231]|uniref:IS110 family transposase n=1 Tax=Streptomyces sp. NPDC005231 TaxID=3157026 RepID=UPI0033BE6751